MKNILKIITVDADVANIPAAVRNQGDWLREVTGDLSIPDNAAFTFAGSIFHKFESPSLFSVTLPDHLGWGYCYPSSDLYGAEGTLLSTVSISSPVLQPKSLGGVPVARISGAITVYVGEELELPFFVDVKAPTLIDWQLVSAALTPVGLEGFTKVTFMASSILAVLPLSSIKLRKGLCLVVAAPSNIPKVRTAMQAAGAENIGTLSLADANYAGDVWIIPEVMAIPLEVAYYRPVISVTSAGMHMLPERVSELGRAANSIVTAVSAMSDLMSDKLNSIATAIGSGESSQIVRVGSGFGHVYFSSFPETARLMLNFSEDADGIYDPGITFGKTDNGNPFAYIPTTMLINSSESESPHFEWLTPKSSSIIPNRLRIQISLAPMVGGSGTLGVDHPVLVDLDHSLLSSKIYAVVSGQKVEVTTPSTFNMADVKMITFDFVIAGAPGVEGLILLGLSNQFGLDDWGHAAISISAQLYSE